MSGQSPVVFVSYAHEDSDFVLRLADDLGRVDVKVWQDKKDIPLGVDWTREAERGIDNCTSVLVVLSPKSIQSDHVRAELYYAKEKQKHIIPVLYEKCAITLLLVGLQYVDLTGDNYDEGVLRIADSVRKTITNRNELSSVQLVGGEKTERRNFYLSWKLSFRRFSASLSIALISVLALYIVMSQSPYLGEKIVDPLRTAVHTDKAEQIQETRLPPTVGPEAKADVSKARTETETVEAVVSIPESKTAAGSKPQMIEEIERKERQVVPPPITEKASPRAVKKTEIAKQPEVAKKTEATVPPPITKKATPSTVKETEIPKQAEVAKKPTEQPVPTDSENQIASINRQREVPPIAPERRLIGLAIVSSRTSINVKDKVSLTVKGKYSDGRDEIVAGVRWQSSNEYIAEVNSKGVLEGKNEGKVEITASYAGVNTVYTVYIKGVEVEVEKPKDSGTPIRDTDRRILR